MSTTIGDVMEIKMQRHTRIMVLGVFFLCVEGLGSDVHADEIYQMYEDEEMLGNGNNLTVTNLHYPNVTSIDRVYIEMRGVMRMGTYHVDPDYEDTAPLGLTVSGYLFEAYDIGWDRLEHSFTKDGEFTVQLDFNDAEWLSTGPVFALQFSVNYTEFAGVPIIDPVFEVVTATFYIVEDGVAIDVLSLGEVKSIWK